MFFLILSYLCNWATEFVLVAASLSPLDVGDYHPFQHCCNKIFSFKLALVYNGMQQLYRLS